MMKVFVLDDGNGLSSQAPVREANDDDQLFEAKRGLQFCDHLIGHCLDAAD